MRLKRVLGLLVIGCQSDPTSASDAGSPPDAATTDSPPPPPSLPSVTEHHNQPTRNGVYSVVGLTQARVATLHLDTTFHASFKGAVNAQPLFVSNGPQGRSAVYVVTQANDVLAFAADNGKLLWAHNLGAPASFMNDACPASIVLGITSTPIVDVASRTLYLDAVLSDPVLPGKLRIKSHQVHALSIDDGSERAGWPVDPTGLVSNGNTFDPTVQHQRGALAIESGVLYLPYGSLGDCGNYHGWVIGISLLDPTQRSAWSTPGPMGGIWGPSGVASDGTNLFFSTGNGGGAVDGGGSTSSGGESVFRFKAGGAISANPDDAFTPSNWAYLDAHDEDVGGSGVIVVHMPSSYPPELAIALGKDGNLYMLDSANLGGADGGGLQQLAVATFGIVDAPAAVPNDKGVMLVFDAQSGGQGVGCPAGQSGDLVAVQIAAGNPPTAAVAWCANNRGHGSPMITTTDGIHDATLWITADASGQLHGYDAQTGAVVFAGGADDQRVSGLTRFNTLIFADSRFFVGADNGLYAFAP